MMTPDLLLRTASYIKTLATEEAATLPVQTLRTTRQRNCGVERHDER